MAEREAADRFKGKKDSALLKKLTHLAKQISRGNYTRAKKIFELTKASTYPRPITELAEAFGMMLVKVESREFKLEQLVEDLGVSCKKLTSAQRTLRAFNRTLEKKIAARTEQLREKNLELSRAMQNLKGEIRERQQAQRDLQRLNEEVEGINQKLQDAYLQMRQEKDQLAARKFQESIFFLTTDDGRICGFTEKALQLTKKSRSVLQNSNVQEILTPLKGQSFADLSHHVRPGFPSFTTLQVGTPEAQTCEATLTRFSVDGQRFICIVLYR
ncbi:MAG: hypothetical protein LLG93_02580 [Deltaproteobacteria bacterium]|nr:hypothetical protein [Deltaproteobacteria bacterium]